MILERIVLFFMAFLGSQAGDVLDKPAYFSNISPDQSQALIKAAEAGTGVIVLDVRSPAEFSHGFIKGAVLMDLFSADFGDELAKLDKKQTYLVYCRSGRRSARAMSMMKKMGFERVYNLNGGIMLWQSKNLPIEKAVSKGL